MAQDFIQQFQYNIDIVPDRSSLINIKNKPTESFREYAIKWREEAAKVKPPMKEAEIIDYFLQAPDPDYLHYMLAAMRKPFTESIKIGEIVENCIKSGKIVSQAALKLTTQAIQSGSGSFRNRKKKEEGCMMASGFGGVQRGVSPSYVQFQQGQSNSPQHYYPPQGPRYSVPPQQYTVFNAQAYARSPNHQQWRAPIPQGSRQLRPNFQAPYNPRPGQEYMREQEPKKEFTLIGESYTSLFRKLMQLRLIEPIMPRYVNPNSNVFLLKCKMCYSLEELRKSKQARENHLPVKEPVAEKDAEEFLKKMKMQDYSIIDQLRKTPAQISLLSLLLHSEVNRHVLIKTPSEAYVLEKTTVNQLEKITERFFEVNRITFSDDDFPEEGAGHNRALHLMVKCEGHYVKIWISSVSIRAFDGSKRDNIGEIELTMTIGPVDFNIVFQVLDMETSYNFLLGRSWIHMARAIPSTLHQMVKFEYDRQEIVVHGEDDPSVYKDPSLPCIEAKEGCESIIYQAFEVIEVDQVEEGKPILHPRLSATSMMVAALMLRNGYEPGKGLGSSLHGIVNPIAPFSKKDTFGLDFKPKSTNIDRAKARKKNGWNLSKPIPHIAYSFVKPQFEEVQNPST
ncbi:uncharacterized protein [Nicotiana tomentosiformis]|uniref:uncharacterized protein n=1 Tax=Nicotiana tomentosiformis TaxID=4098 RepID=UPI00388C6713